MTQSLKERMTKTRVKLLKKSPFFGTLLINAPWREDESVPTAATDGKGLMFNPKFMETLNEKQMAGVVLHELGHVFLQHVPRMRDIFRHDPVVANIAADIVVNGIIDDNRLELPDGAVRDDKLKHLSVREVYSVLKQKQSKDKNYLKKKFGVEQVNVCLVDGDGDGNDPNGSGGGTFIDNDGNAVEAPDWKDVLNKAATIARMKKAGPVGAAMDRLFKELLEPSIDWRTLLYKYITEARTDFEGYDRRFAYRNLYLDDFAGSTVHVLVYIDVSGSIEEKVLTEFISELNGAVSAVNSIKGEVYCFDTQLHPVCEIADLSNSFRLIGGGGTDFAPIISHIEKYRDEKPVYLSGLHTPHNPYRRLRESLSGLRYRPPPPLGHLPRRHTLLRPPIRRRRPDRALELGSGALRPGRGSHPSRCLGGCTGPGRPGRSGIPPPPRTGPPRSDSPHAVPTRHPSPLSPCDTGVGWAWKSPPPYRWKSPPPSRIAGNPPPP
jgi:predicted metal-dependent peptidase